MPSEVPLEAAQESARLTALAVLASLKESIGDLDRIVAWHQGGRTESTNLAPLCRLHHRMKTHGSWTYRRIDLTTFEWTSPMGRVYVNDLTHKRRRTH